MSLLSFISALLYRSPLLPSALFLLALYPSSLPLSLSISLSLSLSPLPLSAPQVRLCNMPAVKSMRELDPRDIDQLITLHGMVIRCAPIVPDMRTAFYECVACHHSGTVLCVFGAADGDGA
jgi:DNA replicative helicase MCM subunit Mcm2 (Cdc46/Mcm family)